jgi:hypothetical protein
VLEARDRLLRLHPLRVPDRDATGEPRILAEVVVGAAAEGRPLDVEAGTEDDVFAAGPGFLADDATVALGELGVPRRGQRDPDRHRRREVVRPPRGRPRVEAQLLTHAVGPVGRPQMRHAQPRDAARPELPVRVHEPNLLFQCQAAEQIFDAGVAWLRRVEVRRPRLGERKPCERSEGQRAANPQ